MRWTDFVALPNDALRTVADDGAKVVTRSKKSDFIVRRVLIR